MNYYLKEIKPINSRSNKTGGSKVRKDIEEILKKNGFNEIIIPNVPRLSNRDYISTNFMNHYLVSQLWNKKTKLLKENDNLIIQFPLIIQHSIFLEKTLKNLVKRRVNIILIIHDIESLRVTKRSDISKLKSYILKKEEKLFFSWSSKIVVHNLKMKNFLINIGIKNEKLISIEIFDYLISNEKEIKSKTSESFKNQPIIIAGTLRLHKAKYIYYLPVNVKFNLYGVGYHEQADSVNIDYKGSFSPEQLPYELQGSFGLVWDGNSSLSCEGIYGKYLVINNPHKLSLYLVSGIPIIIWKNAAQADFILKNKCGVTVDSLDNLHEVVNSISEEEYTLMKKRAKKIGKNLKNGYYLKRVLHQLEIGEDND